MPEKILGNVRSGYPTPLIPIWSGGCSGWVWLRDHDPAYGRSYYSPFGITDRDGTSGAKLVAERGTEVYIVKKQRGMEIEEWGDRVVDTIAGNLPTGYALHETLCLLTGCNKMWVGEKVERDIGNRKINVHPAPLYVLHHPETGDVVDAWGLPPQQVREAYLQHGYRRRYTGWGKNIIPEYLKEQHKWASTLHIATPDGDHGPNVCVRQKRREEQHVRDPAGFQDELKSEGDGPVITAGVHMILRGLEHEGETLYWEGEPLPYQGLVLEEGWEEELGIEPLR